MAVIGVIGRKGGVGKTTIAVHLAAELSTGKQTVAVVDCDAQGSASYWADPGQLPVPVLHHPLEHAREIQTWSRDVRDIDADLLVLDGPPHLNEAMGGVIGLSDLVVIPCGPSGLDLIATGEAVGLVRQIRDERGDAKPSMLLVPNRVDRRTTDGRDLAGALKDLGEPVGPSIGDRTAFVDAFNAGQCVGAYAPSSPAHQELQALARRVRTILRKL
jgi:chromosome partitioning protein